MNMTVHTRRAPSIFAAPSHGAPGAAFIIFSLTGKIAPCGPHILRRDGLDRHRNLMVLGGSLMLKLCYLKTAHDSDKRLSRGEST
jgi:hypothetical protein